MNTAARALGRSYGALFFSVFGACWMLLSLYAFGVWKVLPIVTVLLVLGLLTGTAVRLQGRAKKLVGDTMPGEERKRDDRTFGIVNAVQWVAVFLIFTFFPRLGINDLAFPAVLLVVGLHFFAMPPSYRHTSNFVIGAVLVIWSVLCPLLFKGDRMIAFIALGAGLTLWVGASSALGTAARLLASGPSLQTGHS